MRNGFDAAKKLHAIAQRELDEAEARADRIAVRQAAEKAWLAVVEATKALLRARGIVPPGGTGRQRDALLAIERRDRRARKLRLLFASARETLHIACFYDDEVGPAVEAAVGDAAEFIRSAERVATPKR